MENLNFKRPQINVTKTLRLQNAYTLALDGEFRDYAFNEERAPLFKSLWRSEIYKVSKEVPLDLEIGTGNGTFFLEQVLKEPQRCLLGIEIKYKPLIQTIRNALKKGALNGRILRYHAFNIDELFEEGELNNVFIHFPDPWTTPKKPKRRLVNPRILDLLWHFQREGSYLEFKTDSREYFLWAMEAIRSSKYSIEYETEDLHNSPLRDSNFITTFEKIFLKQNIPINYVLLKKTTTNDFK